MKPSAKILIVTGDDFGMSPLVNGAIVRAHREGILTSASLMVNGAAFDEAVEMAKDNPLLAVGIHITLVRGAATLSKRVLFDLVDGEGNFSGEPIRAGLRYFFEKKIRPRLEAEIEAQIEKFYSAGLNPSHMDGHLHLHVHPTILKILVRLAAKYSIPAIRLPRESLFGSLRRNSRNCAAKAFHSLTYGCLCAHAESRLRAQQILFPDHFFGLLDIGQMRESHLLKIIHCLKRGVTEIGMHPALALPPEIKKWAPDYHCEEELKALISPRLRERIRELGIRLASYHDLRHVKRNREW
jgi:hopanoid biosynthesis associated protein HpnK